MNRKQRRAAEAKKRTYRGLSAAELYDQIAKSLLQQAGDKQLIIGPYVYDAQDTPYVVASGCDHEFWFIQIYLPDREDRDGVLRALAAQDPGCTVHNMADELSMAELGATLWPCARTKKLVTDISAERAAEPVKVRQNRFYNEYLANLPKVERPTLEPGSITHFVFFHDNDCGIYTDSRACTCNPDVEYRAEPSRS
jgi:hypothetical protein